MCSVSAEQKQLQLSSEGGDSGSKKSKRGYCGAYGGGLAESAFRWSMESGGQICDGVFGRNMCVFQITLQ
jgi:hypothetical protein